jgi:hypothetical protein
MYQYYRFPIVVLIVTDLVIFFSAFLLAYLIRFRLNLPFWDDGDGSFGKYFLLSGMSVSWWLLCFSAFGIYLRRYGKRAYIRIVGASTTAMLGTAILHPLHTAYTPARGWLVLSSIFIILGIVTFRVFFSRLDLE